MIIFHLLLLISTRSLAVKDAVTAARKEMELSSVQEYTTTGNILKNLFLYRHYANCYKSVNDLSFG